VAEPQTLIDLKHLYDKQPLYWSETTTGAGAVTFDSTNAWVNIAVTSGTDDCIRQTFMSFNYQPGKSQLIKLTGLCPQEADTTKRLGYFDANDGIFFEVTGTQVSWGVRKGTVDTKVVQKEWNLDPFNGLGPSGITLDLTKVQVWVIDFEWLGTGRVRVGFVFYAHEFLHGNVSTATYMNSPNLPLRYEITSTGGAGSLKQICSTVISEGGLEERGSVYTVDTGRSATTGGPTVTLNTFTFVVGVRLQTTRPHAVIAPRFLDMLSVAKADIYWALVLNPTVAGTALSWSNVTNSSVQMAIGVANNVVTVGTTLTSGFSASSSSQGAGVRVEPDTFLRPGVSLAGVADVIALCVSTSASGIVLGSIGIQELA
jgi:hypothetical protein